MVGDPQFFQRVGPFDVATVARHAEGAADASEILLEGVASLEEASERQVSFLENRRYLATLADTKAGAVIIHPSLESQLPEGSVAIRSTEPYAAWARVCSLFHPVDDHAGGVHPTAWIDPLAVVDSSVRIGAHAVVEAGATIAAGCRIDAGATVGRGVSIGSDCVIESNASLSHAIVGSRVHIGAGCRIGQPGFGFASTKSGFLAIPQLGRVIIEDDVRIGANTTVDRGSATDTIIGRGTWIDNLVQIAHNVTIGRYCVIVAQVGIAGSTRIGNFVRIGGQAAIAGHLDVGDGASIGAQAGVISNVPPKAELLGSPAQPRRDFFRQIASARQGSRARGARVTEGR
ncbi:MAG: UDP-3-O-acylglucosamine N-acyltransferase [Rhizobiaceae bacterium MnEN-MB40S]|nr:MAG: UDP-3-O-acylglucosamine N-acyltransferase [Rhizobiaceae bacterium MnEN-MB40S]